ncbi:helix-turn-helix transcriptional regulator [Candidatus Bathyarchaeota archaeon]|nr:helix-turn-helix transcriptional regulator [Candidatus Bathyarchaeota archaeon]
MPRHRSKVKKWYKVKFYSKVRSRLLPILKHVDAGNYPAKIARMLGLSKQHLHYYIRKMREARLIKRMNKRLEAEMGRPVAESREHRWVMTRYVHRIWGATKEEMK